MNYVSSVPPEDFLVLIDDLEEAEEVMLNERNNDTS